MEEIMLLLRFVEVTCILLITTRLWKIAGRRK